MKERQTAIKSNLKICQTKGWFENEIAGERLLPVLMSLSPHK